MDAVHKDIEQSKSTRRQNANAAHNKATNIVTPSFHEVYFVVMRRANERGHKPRFKRFGTCCITKVHSQLVYGFTLLHRGDQMRVNCARCIKYLDRFQGTAVPKEFLALTEQVESRYEVVDAITDVGEPRDGFLSRVKWEGLPDEYYHTWHPIAQQYADTPDIVSTFLKTYHSKEELLAMVKPDLPPTRTVAVDDGKIHGGSLARWHCKVQITNGMATRGIQKRGGPEKWTPVFRLPPTGFQKGFQIISSFEGLRVHTLALFKFIILWKPPAFSFSFILPVSVTSPFFDFIFPQLQRSCKLSRNILPNVPYFERNALLFCNHHVFRQSPPLFGEFIHKDPEWLVRWHLRDSYGNFPLRVQVQWWFNED